MPWIAKVPSVLARFVSSGNLQGATTSGYELGANLLNFGALIAFMGVNAAAFVRYYLHDDEKKPTNLLPPVLGFIICLLSMVEPECHGAGFWERFLMAVGIAFGAWKTHGFRGNLVNFELPPEEMSALSNWKLAIVKIEPEFVVSKCV